MRHPVDVFKRNIYVHPFHEEDPVGLIKLIGRRPGPVRFRLPSSRRDGRSDQLRRRTGQGLPEEDVRKIMGGNLARLMHVDEAAA